MYYQVPRRFSPVFLLCPEDSLLLAYFVDFFSQKIYTSLAKMFVAKI